MIPDIVPSIKWANRSRVSWKEAGASRVEWGERADVIWVDKNETTFASHNILPVTKEVANSVTRLGKYMTINVTVFLFLNCRKRQFSLFFFFLQFFNF